MFCRFVSFGMRFQCIAIAIVKGNGNSNGNSNGTAKRNNVTQQKERNSANDTRPNPGFDLGLGTFENRPIFKTHAKSS